MLLTQATKPNLHILNGQELSSRSVASRRVVAAVEHLWPHIVGQALSAKFFDAAGFAMNAKLADTHKTSLTHLLFYTANGHQSDVCDAASELHALSFRQCPAKLEYIQKAKPASHFIDISI